MRIVDCEQGSPEWFAARRGIPTASEFGSIIMPVRHRLATAHDAYINRLIDEIVRPDAERGFAGNRHTLRGKLLEDDAREFYAFERDTLPRRVGFILTDDGRAGASPDSLVDPDGGLEIKCPDGPTHVAWLRAGRLPGEHKPQVHGCLVVSGRAWWDFLSYCPGYPALLLRIERDEFTAKLAAVLAQFLTKYEAERERIVAPPAVPKETHG